MKINNVRDLKIWLDKFSPDDIIQLDISGPYTLSFDVIRLNFQNDERLMGRLLYELPTDEMHLTYEDNEVKK